MDSGAQSPIFVHLQMPKARISTYHRQKWLPQYRLWVYNLTFFGLSRPPSNFPPVDKVQLIFDPGFCAALTKVLLMIIELGEAITRHSLFKGHNVIGNIVVLNCQQCNQCLKCQVSGHKSLGLLWNFSKIRKCSKTLKFFRKSEIFQKIRKFSKNLKIYQKSGNFPKIWKFSENLEIFRKSEKFLKI